MELCFLFKTLLHTKLQKQNSHHTKINTVANTFYSATWTFSIVLLWFKTIIKVILLTFPVKWQILLPLSLDLFSLIIVSNFGRSNQSFRGVNNCCRPKMMGSTVSVQTFPALSFTMLLMGSILFRISGFQCLR